MSYEAEIHDAMRAGIADVVETYGLHRAGPPTASDRPPAPAPDLFCAMLRYSAPALRGVVVIVGPAQLWDRFLDAGFDDTMDELHDERWRRDVAGEVANLLVGRMKLALLPRGIELALGVPTSGAGVPIGVLSGSPQQSDCYELPVGAEVLDVWGDVILEPGFAPRAPEVGADRAAGELILF